MPKGKDIIDVKVGLPGPTADIKLFREQQKKFDKEQEFEGDKAYQGGTNITTPHKKKKKQQLSEQQKEQNKVLSSKRIFVEHLICVVKIFQVASQRFRLNPDIYNEIVLLVCGESALREGFPPQATANPKGLVRLRIGTVVLPT